MKIINWNLKNVGVTKLNKPLPAKIQVAGLGDTVLEYVTKVVMGDPVWEGVISEDPVDVFVVIELICQQTYERGVPAVGSSIRTLELLKNTMNTICDNRGIEGEYQYDYVEPLTIGDHKKGEAIGVIYNERVLTYTDSDVLTENGQRINPRSPFLAQFDIIGTDQSLSIVGIHAPPMNGNDATDPIKYCNALANIAELRNMDGDVLIMGDYNCNPTSTYLNNNRYIGFNNPLIVGFSTLLQPSPTLTSVRSYNHANEIEPANYLSQAFDNIFHKIEDLDIANSETKRLDLIRYAYDDDNEEYLYDDTFYRNTLVERFFTLISDHLPVVINYNLTTEESDDEMEDSSDDGMDSSDDEMEDSSESDDDMDDSSYSDD